MESWRNLKVGDKIRLIEIPPEFLQEDYFVHRDTMRLYKKLLRNRRAIRICDIDEWGLPWIHCRSRLKNGMTLHEFLAFNHGGWVRVKSRNMRTPERS